MTAGSGRERFVELAERRVSRAIKMLRLVGNLSNRSNYSYSEQDAKKIIKVLEGEIRILKRQFLKASQPNEIHFKL